MQMILSPSNPLWLIELTQYSHLSHPSLVIEPIKYLGSDNRSFFNEVDEGLDYFLNKSWSDEKKRKRLRVADTDLLVDKPYLSQAHRKYKT